MLQIAHVRIIKKVFVYNFIRKYINYRNYFDSLIFDALESVIEQIPVARTQWSSIALRTYLIVKVHVADLNIYHNLQPLIYNYNFEPSCCELYVMGYKLFLWYLFIYLPRHFNLFYWGRDPA